MCEKWVSLLNQRVKCAKFLKELGVKVMNIEKILIQEAKF